jgi:glycosyltransferase involved in cell wall biosynthesis
LRYFNIFLYFRIRKIIKDQKATHLFIEHPYYGWLAWMIKKSLRVTWAIHSHNIEFMRSKSIGRWWWRVLKWYEGWVYKNADIIFFISQDDLDTAHKVFRVPAYKSMVATYGVEVTTLPQDIQESRKIIQTLHGVKEDEKILLFNGALYHPSNYNALRVILDYINPVLLKTNGFRYKILVCGKGLPASFNQLKDQASKNVIYAGFVDDISIYFKASDIFLNPILTGGGVKTKVIEALAMNCTVISTEFGAIGINKEVCGNKLILVPDRDWTSFAEAIISACRKNENIPNEYFEYYYWGNIIKKVVAALNDEIQGTTKK